MRTLSIREMRASLGRLDELVDREGELIITRNGQAVARVVPFEASRRISSREDLRRSMPRLSSSAELIREDRDAR